MFPSYLWLIFKERISESIFFLLLKMDIMNFSSPRVYPYKFVDNLVKEKRMVGITLCNDAILINILYFS